MAKIKNSCDNRCLQGCGVRERLLLLVGLLAGKPLWKSVWKFFRKLDIVLPEDPVISHLGIYPNDAPSYNKDTCSTVFIEALFIIARCWKELRCSSVEE